MRKSSLAYPLLAAATGVAAAALRMWQRTAGCDGSGLPVPGAVPALVLTAFLAACAVLFLVLALRQPGTLADQKTAQTCGARLDIPLAASGALFLLGGVLNLLSVARRLAEASSAAYGTAEAQAAAMKSAWLASLLPGALAVASVPAAIALLYRAKRAGGEPEEKPSAFAALAPPLFLWVWLIEVYRQHTANPILWDYALLLLAVITLLLSGYDRAGFAFGAGKPRRSVFLSLLALLFAIAALPDSGGPANAVILIGAALFTAAELYALVRALRAAPAPTQEIQEETTHE